MTLHSTFLMLTIGVLSIGVAQGQTVSTATAVKANVPLFTDYRGVKIGMSADEVRSKLDQIKKGEGQDFLVLSDQESAQIYYDNQGKVTAISVDYFDNGKAPSPDAVLGIAIQAKADGSMYQLNRYPEAGYWVSYNRTAGDKPIVTITMQKM
ncbi:MAG TPA: hypothetical protein VHH35_21665 [Pyrinomonadaceae bacterium]|nr:hypothetical protein [Pyrinomonadaceae bacterium]